MRTAASAHLHMQDISLCQGTSHAAVSQTRGAASELMLPDVNGRISASTCAAHNNMLAEQACADGGTCLLEMEMEILICRDRPALEAEAFCGN